MAPNELFASFNPWSALRTVPHGCSHGPRSSCCRFHEVPQPPGFSSLCRRSGPRVTPVASVWGFLAYAKARLPRQIVLSRLPWRGLGRGSHLALR